MLMVRPAVVALAVVWVIAGYALILGVFEIILGVELRGCGRLEGPAFDSDDRIGRVR
jgi:hypothetical protein